MKIVLISFGYFPVIGGVEVMINYQLEYFKKHGVKNYLITFSPNKKFYQEKQQSADIIRTPYLNRCFDDDSNAKKLKKWLPEKIAEISPDIIYCHNMTFPYGPKRTKALVSSIKENFPNIPLVEHAHNAQSAQHKSLKLQKELATLPWDHIVCVSKYAKSKFVKQGVDSRKISTVYNGIDTNFFNPSNYSRDNLLTKYHLDPKIHYILFPSRPFSTLGAINVKKGFNVAAKAFACLRNMGFCNTILLSPKNKSHNISKDKKSFSKIHKFINQLHIQNNVTFISNSNYKQMPELYAMSDVIIIPSIKEPFGLVYIEAMAMKKILVAVKSGASAEIITNRKTGLLAQQRTPKFLAKEMSKALLFSKSDKIKITSKARQIVIKKFSSKKFGKETLMLCKKIIKKKK